MSGFEIAGLWDNIILFIGILIIGIPVLVPSIFAALQGYVSLASVIEYSIIATLITDLIWYVLGIYSRRHGQRFFAWFERKFSSKYASAFNRKHWYSILFFSRFLYGGKVVIQILCGAYKLPFTIYFVVCFVSIAFWLTVVVFLAFLAGSAPILAEYLNDARYTFTAFIVLFLLLYIAFKKVFDRLYVNKKD